MLHPTKHYRFLPAYLRALDRIVSVSSPVTDFPLAAQHTGGVNGVGGGFLTNGDHSSGQVNGSGGAGDGLGSDESLGGALLTPIPWLRNNGSAASTNGGSGTSSNSSSGHDADFRTETTSSIEGPNGTGSIETVSVTVNGVPSQANSNNSSSSVAHTSPTPASPTLSEQSDASSSSSSGETPVTTEAQLRQQGGVTQGELLRQEQEAGVVPVSQTTSRRSLISGSGAGAAVGRDGANDAGNGTNDGAGEETPHARGPELVGMEDMGPQHHTAGLGGGLNMEAAVGRARSPLPEPAVVVPSDESAVIEEAVAPAVSAGGGAGEKEDVEMGDGDEVAADTKSEGVDGDVVVADADGSTVDEAIN